jgi:CDP-diacylglycerol--glycerol-3-phosphate 3-phosphatidyltransferase
MMVREEFFDRWSEVHGGAEIKGIVRWWLSISFRVASLLRSLRITANSMTVFGVIIAFLLIIALRDDGSEQAAPLLIAALLLVISLAADGVDGSLALLTGHVSRRGAALDAIADRLAESFWAFAFIQIGADYRVVVIAWLMAQTQEYIRARLGGLDVSEIGVVTVSERPVRASFLAVALVVALINAASGGGEILAVTLTSAVTIIAALWLLLQAIALGQLSRFAIRSTIDLR